MLRGLDISDMLIIDRLELGFQPGLNVLTGETGAGKSILLDSLGFVLGWRGRADLVRQGAVQGEVTAWFDLPGGHPAHAVLEDAGLPGGDELILRRINGADGRKTAWVNDRRCSGEVLRALSDTLVELHGQHDDRGLLNPRGHRAILDNFAGNGAARSKVRKAWSTLRAAHKAAAAARAAQLAIKEEEEFLRHAVAELDQLAPEAGEEAELDTKRRQMQGAEKIRSDVVNAYEILGQGGAETSLGDALRWLDGVADKAEGALERPMSAINRALVELDEAMAGVADAIDTMSFNPIELEDAEERLFAIRAMARKHDIAADELAGFASTLRAKLDALDAGEAQQVVLEKAVIDAQTAFDSAAESLSKGRQKAAAKLDKAVSGELAPLKMERAVFATEITPAEEPGPEGIDAVSFTVATNPGAPSGPLGKIASGGELSRFLLALKVCLTQGQPGLTLIFDEIDRGVGGATADAVGRRLSALAEGGQVLVVTHSPQVAALGAHHWRVSKAVAKGVTTSTVAPLAPQQRVDEVARMLSGDQITDAARAAAEALLAG